MRPLIDVEDARAVGLTPEQVQQLEAILREAGERRPFTQYELESFADEILRWSGALK